MLTTKQQQRNNTINSSSNSNSRRWTVQSYSPMCPHFANVPSNEGTLAAGRHLANTIELVLPSAHPSPQPKQHLDRFSHFCPVHCRVSSCMFFPLKIAPSHRGIWIAINTWFLELTIQYGISIGLAIFAQLTAECRRACSFP